MAFRTKQGQNVISLHGQVYTLARCQSQQQDAHSQKQHIQGYERKAVRAHVFLRIMQVLAREILLHHILIQPRHDNHNKNAAQELLHEMLP